MARTQTLVHRWRPRTKIFFLQMDLTRSLVPLVAQATSPSVLCEAQILVLHIKNISQQNYSSSGDHLILRAPIITSLNY